jgi:hypothetical protein
VGGGGVGGGGIQRMTSSASLASLTSLPTVDDEAAAAKSRLKLWEKLNQRYSGDREGEFNKKKEIKEYIYGGISADTHIMNEYMENS